MSDLWICGMTPPPAIVALMRLSNSSSPRMASCKWRGVIRFTFKSFEALPANSSTYEHNKTHQLLQLNENTSIVWNNRTLYDTPRHSIKNLFFWQKKKSKRKENIQMTTINKRFKHKSVISKWRKGRKMYQTVKEFWTYFSGQILQNSSRINGSCGTNSSMTCCTVF